MSYIQLGGGNPVFNANQVVTKDIATTKGDIFVATGDSTVVRQAVGTDGQVLTADSAQTSGIKWASAAGGGAATNAFNYTYSSTTNATGISTGQLRLNHTTPGSATTIWFTNTNADSVTMANVLAVFQLPGRIICLSNTAGTIRHWYQTTTYSASSPLTADLSYLYGYGGSFTNATTIVLTLEAAQDTTYSNVAWVDANRGSDTYGRVGNPALPFATIVTAKTAGATEFFVIGSSYSISAPGTYGIHPVGTVSLAINTIAAGTTTTNIINHGAQSQVIIGVVSAYGNAPGVAGSNVKIENCTIVGPNIFIYGSAGSESSTAGAAGGTLTIDRCVLDATDSAISIVVAGGGGGPTYTTGQGGTGGVAYVRDTRLRGDVIIDAGGGGGSQSLATLGSGGMGGTGGTVSLINISGTELVTTTLSVYAHGGQGGMGGPPDEYLQYGEGGQGGTAGAIYATDVFCHAIGSVMNSLTLNARGGDGGMNGSSSSRNGGPNTGGSIYAYRVYGLTFTVASGDSDTTGGSGGTVRLDYSYVTTVSVAPVGAGAYGNVVANFSVIESGYTAAGKDGYYVVEAGTTFDTY